MRKSRSYCWTPMPTLSWMRTGCCYCSMRTDSGLRNWSLRMRNSHFENWSRRILRSCCWNWIEIHLRMRSRSYSGLSLRRTNSGSVILNCCCSIPRRSCLSLRETPRLSLRMRMATGMRSYLRTMRKTGSETVNYCYSPRTRNSDFESWRSCCLKGTGLHSKSYCCWILIYSHWRKKIVRTRS